jgi:hypothetical protein
LHWFRDLRLALPDDAPSPDALPVSGRTRLLVALAIALAAGVLCWLFAQRPGAVPDLLAPLTGARRFLDGDNPYWPVLRRTAPAPYDEPLYYPFTAVLALAPLARLPVVLASSIVFGLASGFLAYGITRDGLWRLHIFASAPFVVALGTAQLSPLIMVMAFAPAAGFLATVKPNLGLALLLRRPSLVALLSCVAFGLLSLAIFPAWPAHWLESLQRDLGERHLHLIPALQWQWGGVLLLLAVIAWRRPAGRLLLAMGLTPQLLFFYDQLPLWLVPRTRKESIALTACSQLAMLLWFVLSETGDSVVRSAQPYVLALLYLPALLVLMRRARAT